MQTPDELFAAARSLSPSDQWSLVTRLWEALPDEAWTLSDAEVAEFDRRCADADSGKVETLTRHQVSQKLRRWIDGDG